MFGRVHLCSEKGRKVMPAYEVGIVDKIIVWRGEKQHQNVRQIITEKKKLHLNRRRLCGFTTFLWEFDLPKFAKNCKKFVEQVFSANRLSRDRNLTNLP